MILHKEYTYKEIFSEWEVTIIIFLYLKMLIINTSSCDKTSIFVLNSVILLLYFLYRILSAPFDMIEFLYWFICIQYLQIIG